MKEKLKKLIRFVIINIEINFVNTQHSYSRKKPHFIDGDQEKYCWKRFNIETKKKTCRWT